MLLKGLVPQHRQMLLSEHKRQSLLLSRALNRGKSTTTCSECDAEEQLQSNITDLSEELIRLILSHLDPLGLAAAACVNRHWRDVAMRDEMWGPWAECCLTAATLKALEADPLEQKAFFQAFRGAAQGLLAMSVIHMSAKSNVDP